MTRRTLSMAMICALLAGAAMAQTGKRQPSPQREPADPLLEAMLAEMARARRLQMPALEAPYYIEYAVEDTDSFSAQASLGGLLSARPTRTRYPRIQVRVGTYDLDNTNFILSDYFTGSGAGLMPTDNGMRPLREYFWLATDSAYKAAFESFSRKRAALANFLTPDRLDDFSKATAVQKLLPVAHKPVDTSMWTARLRSLSAMFASYPRILSSNVAMEIGQSTSYLVTSEGTVARVPDNLAYITVRATTQADDGSMMNDAALVQTLEADQMPPEAELRKAVVLLAENLTRLSQAPAGENYVGPVLFEGQASAQLFAQLLGRNLALPRKPVPLPGRPVPVLESELEGRMGSRILPEWMEVVDDPTQTEWRGRPLLGHYDIDLEGVVPAPVKVIDMGSLTNCLLTRQPVRGFSASNGRARLLGSFGAKTAAISNLFVRASTTVPTADMKKKLIEMVQKRNKPYGLLIRKLDFPSAASVDELRRMSATMAQSGSFRAVSSPVLVYRVYPDGREELVRGLRFRGVNVRSLRDIVAASEESYLFDFINNTAPFALIGGSNFVAASAVVAPAVLFDELELERPQEDKPTPALVPPPPLLAGR